MSKRSYYISKNKKKKEIVCFELNDIVGYELKPKRNKKDTISVDKIVIVNKDFSEKIIRKKIDKKITYLLNELKIIDEDDSGDNEGIIRKNLMETEKLRLMIINKYKKYLGNTYGSLTLKKIQLITEQLRYKLYLIEEVKKDIYMNNYYKEGRKSR